MSGRTCQMLRGLWFVGLDAEVRIRTDANNLDSTASTTHSQEQQDPNQTIQNSDVEEGGWLRSYCRSFACAYGTLCVYLTVARNEVLILETSLLLFKLGG